MTHLPWIAASYGLAAVVVSWLAVGSRVRLGRARRRLRALDGRS